ncbi:MAG TPA: hypothetical protein VFQ32_05380 [Ktedonobacterales bacterium]|nr:hypothetical protein [Ktedonobacterales bacterium]
MAEGSDTGSFRPRDLPRPTRPLQDGSPDEPRLALSPVIDQTINVMNEREEQRHKLISTLIIVQLLITAAVAFGYHDKPGLIFPIMLASLGVYLLALGMSALLKNDRLAAYILVFGGGLAVAAQVVATTLTGSPEETGHIALFFLAVMLEAGLLMIPDVTVVIATTALALTGALLLLITINKAVSGPQIYLIVLYTLSPMALTGIVSWLLAHFIYDTSVTAQHAQDIEFRQAHLQQMKAHERDRQEQFDASIRAIQTAIAQAITGDYTVRVPVSAGDLEVVENSLNLLLDTFDSMALAQQENARMAGAVPPITDALNRLNDSPVPVHPIKTDTPFDNLSVMVTRIADNYGRRVARLQEQLGNVSAGVSHSRDGLVNASNEFVAAKQQTGALIARADKVQASLQKQLDLLAQARRMMAVVLPGEITQVAEPSEGGNPALRGLGIGVDPGYTREFEALAPTTPAEAGIAPLTMPLAAINPDRPSGASPVAATSAATNNQGAHGSGGASGSIGDGLPTELVEVWHLLLQIGEELTQQERIVGAINQELGILSKTVRSADSGIAWTLTALDTVQKTSDSAQSSASHPIPDGLDDGSSGGQDRQDSGGFPMRPAGPSRPLWPGSGSVEGVNPPPARGSLNAADLLGGGDTTPTDD